MDKVALLLPGTEYSAERPLLRDSQIPADLRRAEKPFLLAGGTADPTWDPAVARSFGRPIFEAPDADHNLEIPGDPVRSAGLLRDVTLAMDVFVRQLT